MNNGTQQDSVRGPGSMFSNDHALVDLSDAEWVALLDSTRGGLPSCCNTDSLRAALAKAAVDSGQPVMGVRGTLHEPLAVFFSNHSCPSALLRKVVDQVDFPVDADKSLAANINEVNSSRLPEEELEVVDDPWEGSNSPRIVLEPSEWMELVDQHRGGLPPCCGNIAALRKEIIGLLFNGGYPVYGLHNLHRALSWCYPDPAHPPVSPAMRKVIDQSGWEIPETVQHSRMAEPF